ncbi:uncharacterized protein LOC119583392 [Penaeus monodon]|uniref:uncharacterized protein LOC119583392 n=1 Tax=Penaeus monodon TaxID=6687 RepID=UPI0018A72E57|nr:uncharacterized protein LOC119583392 [Penaeus monodon]
MAAGSSNFCPLSCPKCGQECRITNEHYFRCDKSKKVNNRTVRCNFKKSLFKNTWFDNSKLDFETNLKFVNLYVREAFSYESARSDFQFPNKTICDWASFCREVLISWCLDNESDQIGGPGEIVEIDESKFGKRKYNVGRLIEGQWVFGGVCRKSRKFFFVPVQTRDSLTLLKVIKERIHPGTTVISDCWKAYNCLETEGYQHLTVNHSYNFVDPDTKAHTNTIERKWRDAKAKVPRFGRRRYHFIGYLARAIFMMAHPEENKRLHQFLLAADRLYPPH